jgi:phenylacetate-CoA ligase
MQDQLISPGTKLAEAIRYAAACSPFYRDYFSGVAVSAPGVFLSSLPFTSKEHLHTRNRDFWCVQKNRIAEYCTTSGTTGQPLEVPLTEADLVRLAKNEHHSFITAGCSADDVFQLMLTLDRQFMAGLAYHSGARMLHAGVVRTGPGNAAMQLDTMRRAGTTVLVAVPSFVLMVVRYAQENAIDLNELPVKRILCIGENIRTSDLGLNPLGRQIRAAWNVKLHATYASTEMQTAFTECEQGNGVHHNAELIHAEIVRENGEACEEGEYGELTITTLGVEGMPLVRYRTGDMCTWFGDACACGRTGIRLSPIAGRRNQLIKLSGTTLYPQGIFNILNSLTQVEDYVIIATTNKEGNDDLSIRVACEEATAMRVRQALQSVLRIIPKVEVAPVEEIRKSQVIEGKRKPMKFVDLR